MKIKTIFNKFKSTSFHFLSLKDQEKQLLVKSHLTVPSENISHLVIGLI